VYPLWKLPAIRIAPDTIFNIGPLPVTNTLLCTWITIVILVVLFFLGTRNQKLIPSGIQNLLEWAVELLLGLVESVAGKIKGKRFFPLVATFFIFILFANLLDVIPGVDTIGTISTSAAKENAVLGFLLFGQYSNDIIPWIRPATSDLNLTLALALVSVITTQAFGFYWLGWKEHLSKYFNFKGPVDFFVGILEIVTEAARILSFSFRLFGNIFAGGAVLTVFAFLLPFFADAIFIPLELFVAFIQAFIFAILTLVFMQIATSSHEPHTESEHEALEEYRHEEARKEEELAGIGPTR
jgi:F-type H+-transporting ATPase subunit a